MKKTHPPHVTVGQIYSGVLISPTPAGNGWQVRLECDVDAIVPRPYGSRGPLQGDVVSVRVLGINSTNGAVVGTLLLGTAGASIA
jgi:hypothetical protein